MNLRKSLWFTAFCSAAMMLAAANAQALLYKWTDENGRVVYGDQPPASVKAERVNPGIAPPDPGAVRSMAAKDAEIRKRQQDRADAQALDVHRSELQVALLRLLHVDLHLQAAEPERDLHVRRPAPLVVHVEALDARHRLRHRGGIVQHLPHGLARRREVPFALDVHALATSTRFISTAKRRRRWPLHCLDIST